MGKFQNLTGKNYGKLTVVEYHKREKWTDSKGRKRKNIYWKCKCDCGNEVIRTEHSLREERTRSCGCNKINQSKNKKIKKNEEEFE